MTAPDPGTLPAAACGPDPNPNFAGFWLHAKHPTFSYRCQCGGVWYRGANQAVEELEAEIDRLTTEHIPHVPPPPFNAESETDWKAIAWEWQARAESTERQVETLRQERDEACTALEFAQGAILDAIGLEDGLDGLAGAKVIQIIRAALAKAGKELIPLLDDTNEHEYEAFEVVVDASRKLVAAERRVRAVHEVADELRALVQVSRDDDEQDYRWAAGRTSAFHESADKVAAALGAIPPQETT